MNPKSKFPWWLVFNLTCFLSWLSVLTPGIIVKNKNWIYAGLIYMIPFILIFSVPENTAQKNKIDEINRLMLKKDSLSNSDLLKYENVIKIWNRKNSTERQIDSLLKINYESNTVLITELEKLNKQYEKNMKDEILKVHPEIKQSTYANIIYSWWLLATIAAFVHSLLIIKKYRDLVALSSGEISTIEINSSLNKEKIQTEYEILQSKVEEIQARILHKIKKSKEFDSYIVEEIKEHTDQYANQIKRLIKQEEELSAKLKYIDLEKLSDDLSKLNDSLSKESNPRLERETKDNIDAKQKLINSYKELKDMHKSVLLRLETAVSSLEQVENDLIKLENVFSTENKEEFFKSFDKKSEELNFYVNQVKKNFDEL